MAVVLTSCSNSVTLELVTDDRGVAELLQQLVSQRVGIRSFAEKEPTLEDVFIQRTGHKFWDESEEARNPKTDGRKKGKH